MIRLPLSRISFLLSSIQQCEFYYYWQYTQNAANRLDLPAAENLWRLLRDLGDTMREIDCTNSAYDVEQISSTLRMQVDGVGVFPTCESMHVRLSDMRGKVQKDLGEHTFAYIPALDQQYWESKALFGEKVNEAFPFAKADIKESGTCMASGLYTASVFHTMRVAERGLRSLAKHLRAKVKDTPLDYAEWHKVIRALEGKIAELNATSRSKKKQDALEFYQGAIIDLRALKDIYRNNVSHCRVAYDEHQAKHAMIHTMALMQTLANRLSEKKETLPLP